MLYWSWKHQEETWCHLWAIAEKTPASGIQGLAHCRWNVKITIWLFNIAMENPL